MVVTNPCVNDARVIKEAEALAKKEFKVTVVCRRQVGILEKETINNVDYVRLAMGGELIDLSKFIFFKKIKLIENFLTKSKLGKIVEEKISYTAEKKFEEQSGKNKSLLPKRVRRILFALKYEKKKTIFYLRQKLYSFLRYVVIRPAKIIIWHLFQYRLLKKTCFDVIKEIKPDVIHVHDLAPLALGVKVSKETGAKLIYDAHELETHRNGLGFLKRKIVSCQEKKFIKYADAVITVSNSIAKHLAFTYKIPEPYVIYNAPEIIDDVEKKHKSDIRKQIKVDEANPLCIYVGKITFNRGLDNLINALVFYDDLRVALLGPVHEPTLKRLLNLAEDAGVNERLYVVESVPPEQVISFINTADIGIVPTIDVCLSYRYSMPNKLFEMTFARLPICVSNLPEQRRFVEEVGNGLVFDKNEPKEIAACLKKCIGKKNEMQLSDEKFIEVKNKYSWARQSGKLISIYDKLCAN